MRTLGCLLVGMDCLAVVFLFGIYGFGLILIVLLLTVLFRKAR